MENTPTIKPLRKKKYLYTDITKIAAILRRMAREEQRPMTFIIQDAVLKRWEQKRSEQEATSVQAN